MSKWRRITTCGVLGGQVVVPHLVCNSFLSFSAIQSIDKPTKLFFRATELPDQHRFRFCSLLAAPGRVVLI